ncbi:hypothetical protein RISK_006516 [Rhodopirellula islandica]|uniref:Uncharacterized protein n=1 Tax=Rhodopirellula islandica TaxID=595434 RepID=A0A0J1B379_RHOIS|nr:hypothetical protein RISK_006516 [Rhodopirellula islandica]
MKGRSQNVAGSLETWGAKSAGLDSGDALKRLESEGEFLSGWGVRSVPWRTSEL